MGFNTGLTYNMSVYFTDKGLEALYSGGLKNKLTYFALGSEEINYLDFSGSTYNYNNTSTGEYTISGSSINIPEYQTLNVTGKMELGKLMNDKQILKTSKKNIEKIVYYAPDAQTTFGYNLTSYKISNGKKFFNITKKGKNKKPIVLGGKNMYTGRPSDKLYYEPRDSNILGFTDVEQPVFNTIPAGNTKVAYPGVSVTKINQSKTEEQRFYIYNQSRNSLFFDSLVMKSIEPYTHRIKNTTVTENVNTKLTTIDYLIEWTTPSGVEHDEGVLTVKGPSKLFKNNRPIILPFEKFEFSVKYSVVNPGISTIHYHGQTNTNPNNKQGTIYFSLEFNTFINQDSLNIEDKVSEVVDIVVQTKNSGYDLTSFSQANDVLNISINNNANNNVSIGESPNTLIE